MALFPRSRTHSRNCGNKAGGDRRNDRARFDEIHTKLQRLDEDGMAYLKITVKSADKERVGRAFADAVVAQALSSVPGYSSRTPPTDATPFLVYWPALIARDHIHEQVHLGAESIAIAPVPLSEPMQIATAPRPPRIFDGPTHRLPLGRIYGARSGDKGGNANLGVWARSLHDFDYLRFYLTVDRLKALCPTLAPYSIDRHELPNLLALNFYVRGILGEGVASSTRTDPQAKILAEYLRAQIIDFPV